MLLSPMGNRLLSRRPEGRRTKFLPARVVGPDVLLRAHLTRLVDCGKRRASFLCCDKRRGDSTMASDRDTIIARILAERSLQFQQWGGDAHDDAHDPLDWIILIEKQLGEARLVGVFSDEVATSAFCRRLVKIAALAIAGLESIARKSQPGPKMVHARLFVIPEDEEVAYITGRKRITNIPAGSVFPGSRCLRDRFIGNVAGLGFVVENICFSPVEWGQLPPVVIAEFESVPGARP